MIVEGKVIAIKIGAAWIAQPVFVPGEQYAAITIAHTDGLHGAVASFALEQHQFAILHHPAAIRAVSGAGEGLDRGALGQLDAAQAGVTVRINLQSNFIANLAGGFAALLGGFHAGSQIGQGFAVSFFQLHGADLQVAQHGLAEI